MTSIDRRRLLSSAVLGTAGATALGSLAPEAAFAGTPGATSTISLDPGVRDPNFAEGRIAGINGPVLLVHSSDGAMRRILVTNGTSIWKLTPTTYDNVKVGDGLYARGVPLADGLLAADAVWVNIVNLHVEIRGIRRGSLELSHHGARMMGFVTPSVTAAVYNGTPPVSDLSQLKVGTHAQIVGAWRPDTNDVDIATIYADI